MTKASLFSLFFSRLFSIAIGQTSNLVLTYEQNNKWLDSLSTLSLDNKLRMINERLLSDTNVFTRQSYPDRIKAADQIGNRKYSDGKPILVVNQSALIIDNKTQNKKIIALTQLLTTDYIADITVLKATEPATLALYGTSGQCGILLLRLKKKKFNEKFKELKLISSYAQTKPHLILKTITYAGEYIFGYDIDKTAGGYITIYPESDTTVLFYFR